ncbi:MAG: ABC transporter ATP-binding protein [Myxococcota bacterium]
MSADSPELIRFVDLYKSFGENRVFSGLNLSVRRGETLTVIGGSGAGKSVLLKTLIGLERPDAGRVYFEGADVTRMAERELREVRRKVAMVFQGAALFDSMTVLDNVAYPLRVRFPRMAEEEIRARSRSKLALVSLSGAGHLLPSSLSGGMRKRVGLARAIATEPEVILWDEPTTGLDPISRRTINTLIVSMQKKLEVTSIVVTHDMTSAFAVSDRIAMLADRRIVEVGAPDELKGSRLSMVREFLDARALEEVSGQ